LGNQSFISSVLNAETCEIEFESENYNIGKCRSHFLWWLNRAGHCLLYRHAERLVNQLDKITETS
jgi:hypothetical protein